MDLKERYGNWGLVAGAAEGLGEAYCRELAGMGINLIMVDHKEIQLFNLADQLMREGVSVRPIHLDLNSPDAADRLNEEILETGCRLLIYNAAYSRVKPFLDHQPEELDEYVDVNFRTPLRLIHGFASGLRRKGAAGGILLMSSLAGLIGMKFVAAYASTKAATWNLAEALHHEFSSSGIDIMACIAGATATRAYLDTQPQYGILKPAVMKPRKVAKLALKKLGRKNLYITGWSNRVNYFILTRFLPRKTAAALANKTMGKMYRHLKNEEVFKK